ncbi:MAG: hypothetical protein IPK60_06720 [Sandaracinaceae bacterium]|nr:hypothetical protein [Sandaracinaceae bacterium]
MLQRWMFALFYTVALAACTGTLSASGTDAGGTRIDMGFDAGLSVDLGAGTDLGRRDAGAPLTDSGAILIDAAPADAEVIDWTLYYTASFQGADIPNSLNRDEVADDSLMLVPAPWDSSRQALRVLVRVGERWRRDAEDGGYPRSEVNVTDTMARRLQWNVLHRIVGAFSFDADQVFPTDGDHGVGTLIAGFQLHGDDSTSPVIALVLSNGRLQIDYRPTSGSLADDVTDCGEAPRGVRVPYEMVYRPATDSTGYLSIRVNGTLVERRGVSNRAANPTPGYMKFGLYDFWHTVNPSLAMYLDDIMYYRQATAP